MMDGYTNDNDDSDGDDDYDFICPIVIMIGTIFALYLGSVTIEHADFKTKLCKKV